MEPVRCRVAIYRMSSSRLIEIKQDIKEIKFLAIIYSPHFFSEIE